MDRVDTAMGELVARYIQLEMGTTYDPPAPAAAEQLKADIKRYQGQRRAGTLDGRAFVDWAAERVPWLRRALGDEPEPPRPPPPPPVPAEERPRWVPPAAPGIPAPTPAHQAIADRIIRGDRRPQE
jgi:hypothetical protein